MLNLTVRTQLAYFGTIVIDSSYRESPERVALHRVEKERRITFSHFPNGPGGQGLFKNIPYEITNEDANRSVTDTHIVAIQDGADR